MRTFLLVVGLIAAAIIVLFVLLVWRTQRASRRRDRQVRALLDPVLTRIASGDAAAAADIVLAARNPLTRNRLYEALERAQQSHLFPVEYINAEAFAESDLAYWLSHPNELGQAPDELELIGRFTRDVEDSGTAEYFVFKFRTRPPHWAAKDGWLAGIAGPYQDGARPRTMVAHTFSRFDPLAAHTPAGHLDECLKATSSIAVTPA
jgi:hypothetical protein